MGRMHRLAVVVVSVAAAALMISRAAKAGPLAQASIQDPAHAAVLIEDNVYRPRMTTIAVGEQVTWTNEGSNEHTTTSDSDVWDSDTLQEGDSFGFTFEEPGIYAYFCRFHRARGMVGTVVVLAPGTEAEGGAAGGEGAEAGAGGGEGAEAGAAGGDGNEGALAGGAEGDREGPAESGDSAVNPADAPAAGDTAGDASKGMPYPPPVADNASSAPHEGGESPGQNGDSPEMYEGAEKHAPGYGAGMAQDDDRDGDDDRDENARDDDADDRHESEGRGNDDGYDRDDSYSDDHGDYDDAGDGYYVVRPGDSLSGIAARLGVPIMSLAYANGIYNLDYIRFGEVLAIPGHDGGDWDDGDYGHGMNYGDGWGTSYTPYGHGTGYGYYPYAYGMTYQWPNYGYSKPNYGYGYSKPNYGYGYSKPNYGYGYSKPNYGNGYTKPNYGYGYAKPNYGYGYAKPNYGYGYAKPNYGYGYAKPNYGYGFGWAKKAYGYGWPYNK